MKKTLFSALSILTITCSINAQLSPVGANGLTTSKYVGIGMNPQQNSFPPSPDYLYVKEAQSIFGENARLSLKNSIENANFFGNLYLIGSGPYVGQRVGDAGDLVLSATESIQISSPEAVSINYWESQYDEKSALYVSQSVGNVGIHTTTPWAKLHVKDFTATNEGDIKQIHGILIQNNGWRDHDFAFEIRTGKIHSENNPEGRIFTVSNSGTVHIGNRLNGDIPYGTGQPYKLWVQDGVRTESVRVDIAAENGWAWADYVFDENYDLMELSKVEEYISKNGHLPGVPSAEEVYKNGIELAEMNKILLEKIEELTLHVIELEKKINNE